MAKKTAELSAELREAIFEAARAGALEAYAANTGDFVNYFKATETLLYNYKKLACRRRRSVLRSGVSRRAKNLFGEFPAERIL